MLRIAVFEDNSHLRNTLQLLLEATDGFYCTGLYPDCSEMLEVLQENPCDIVLMDIEMPGLNGIDATKIIRKHFPGVHVLIQTAFFDDSYIFNAICAGASGYILKTTSPSGYIDALKEVESGGSPMTPGIARRMLELFRVNLQPSITTDYQLTPREKEILQMLVNGKSYKMIAAESNIATDTVKSHIKNIYAKLHVNSGTEAVSKALRDKIV